MSLFQKSVVNKYLANLDQEELSNAYKRFQKFNSDSERIENIKQLKEENYQTRFLDDIFCKVLGYTLIPDKNYNLTNEFKNETDSKKADGAILKDGKAIGVIELKSTKTVNLESITKQAFNYKNNQSKCKYVITSNFEKLNFYIDNTTEWEEFNLFSLTEKDFALFYLLLNHKNLLNDVPLQIKKESRLHEENISDKLYKDYSQFKHKIYNNLVKNNPQYDKLVLFKKSQKLLDRVLFILFAEDSGLVPPNAISKIVDQYEQLKVLDEEQSLYSRFIKFFTHLNVGHTYKEYSLPAYNGGLFKEDEILDNVHIDDEILLDDMLHLSSYDFSTEVDVNILGHIFEHSLTEIEELTAELEGAFVEREKSKRKKDGIFYTPKYITKYIVDNTIGALCNEKKKELNRNEIDEQILENSKTKSGSLTVKAEKIFNNLDKYREYILTLKILDPACGSGAFLNQALEFLISEHKWIDEQKASLLQEGFAISEYEKDIVENNIYGVDINEEAVEIAKLSLWLRTAKKGRKLSTLSNNIKCGNSLIDDPEIAGEKAFNWNEEFKEIMSNGGFDVVIGNPPYISRGLTSKYQDYIRENYVTSQYQLEYYIAFMERAVSISDQISFISFIVPNSWMKNMMMSECRKFLIESIQFKTIIPDLINVFSDANVDTMIFTASKLKKTDNIKILSFVDNNVIERHNVKQDRFLLNDNYVFDIEVSEKVLPIITKMQTGIEILENLFDVTRGINPYDKYRGQTQEVIRNRKYHSTYKKDATFVPELKGLHVSRYNYNWDGKHFVSFGNWLAAPRDKKYYEGNRIVFREILGERFVSTLISEDFKIDRSLYIAKLLDDKKDILKIEYVLGLLNSRLLAFYFRYIANEFDSLFPKIRLAEFKKLPLKETSLEAQNAITNKSNYMLSIIHDKQELVNKFIHRIEDYFELEKVSKKLQSFYDYDFKQFRTELKKQKVTLSLKQQDEWEEYFNEYKTEINRLQEQITKTDNEIDVMVYKLYNLTYEEVKIVDPNFWMSEGEYENFRIN